MTIRPAARPTGTMSAVVAHGAADLRLDELPVPAAGPGQVAVRVRYGGICGSDLRYWRHGRVGDFTLREPLVLGHEVVGTRVRDLASAALWPHVQGGLAEVLVVRADQVVPLPAGPDLLITAVDEAFALAGDPERSGKVLLDLQPQAAIPAGGPGPSRSEVTR